MKVIALNKEQVTEIYQKYMLKDFPDMERKPLAMILEGMERQSYECLGAYDGEQFMGYAFFNHKGEEYLFDYFAINPELRSRGIGSRMISFIKEYFHKAECVFGEVEDYTLAEVPEEKEIQQRRYNFYLRNGLVDTGVRVRLFHVDYIVLELPIRKVHSREEIREIYNRQYSSFLPEDKFLSKVQIKE